MSAPYVRPARREDAPAIAALNTRAFGGPDEARIVRQLARDGDGILSLVALDGSDLVGHIQFFRILVDRADIAAGLGPMSVPPERQGTGIGTLLIEHGVRHVKAQGRRILFVLGHEDYYPRFGFRAEVAAPFTAPWSGPAFMALPLSANTPTRGALAYPAAFGSP